MSHLLSSAFSFLQYHSPTLLALVTHFLLFHSLSASHSNLPLEALLVCFFLLIFFPSSSFIAKYASICNSAAFSFLLTCSFERVYIYIDILYTSSCSCCSLLASVSYHLSFKVWQGSCKTVCSHSVTCLQGNTRQFCTNIIHTSIKTITHTPTFHSCLSALQTDFEMITRWRNISVNVWKQACQRPRGDREGQRFEIGTSWEHCLKRQEH